MLPKALRIPKEELSNRFPEVLKTPLFSVRARGNRLNHNRFAVVVGVKSGNAVRRHWLRRRITPSLKRLLSGDRDYLIILQPKAATVSVIELRQAINELTDKMKR